MNPYLPLWEYVPDGEPYVFGERLYIFGSHDESHSDDFCLGDYVCWSAPIDDLEHWACEGIIYKKTQDPMNTEGRHHMYAPDVVQGLDGRYYLYYVLDSLGVVAVAVSEQPAGKYDFYGYVGHKVDSGQSSIKLLAEPMPYDPAVLVDEGHVYLYYGFCPNFHIPWVKKRNHLGCVMVELEADMKTLKNEGKDMVCVLPEYESALGTSFEGHAFFEAASIRKIDDHYNLIYASEKVNELCYATSDRPQGPYEYGGTIISNGDIGYQGRESDCPLNYTGNIHGGLVQVQGQWYIFYHRHTQGTQFSRQGCAEKVMMDQRGHIDQVEMTSMGLSARPLPAKGHYNAHYACNLMGPKGAVALVRKLGIKDEHPYYDEYEDKLGQFQHYIAHIQKGTVIGYKYFYFQSDLQNIEIGIRGQASGRIFFAEDVMGLKVLGEMTIQVSSGTWQHFSCELKEIYGKKAIYIHMDTQGTLDFKGIKFLD